MQVHNMNKGQRRWVRASSSLSCNTLYKTNPWIVFWWSLAFPGFGHIFIGHYIWGFILVTFEFVVNSYANLNEAIFLSMIGDIVGAKKVLQIEWIYIYVIVYIFAAFDSYRRCREINQIYELAFKEDKEILPFQLSTHDINVLAKTPPWIGVVWSFFAPGLGAFYLQKMPLFLFSFVWWFVTFYFSRVHEGVFFSLIGEIDKVKVVVDEQWLLFTPSIYVYSMYYSYMLAVENNKIFDEEKARYLSKEYQKGSLMTLYE